uniref:Putative inactive purple acid phosphatase 16 n=1 Tax=Anthurium amnicola TaxID=1678845 RepID=A0A1D1ZJS0_9ARAE
MGTGPMSTLHPRRLLFSTPSSLFQFLLLLCLLAAVYPFPSSGDGGSDGVRRAIHTEKELRFSAGSNFKVALFADLHYGESACTDWGPMQDDSSDWVMATILDRESPDFVIYLGDVITANNLPTFNASSYWDRAISPTRSRGIPWASVFGNHDDAAFEWPPEWFSAAGIPQPVCLSNSRREHCSFKGTTRVELMKEEIGKNLLSFTMPGSKKLWPSVSNYVLKVFSSKYPDSVVALLYFFDSGGGSYPEVISNAQAQWFQETSEEINPGSRIPEIILWHIPSTAYEKVSPSRTVGIQKPCVGSINLEGVAPQTAEWGMMDALLQRPSVKAVFVGHNHGLDWCCPYKSLWLCFARHTGYGGYGDWPRGVRIIEITEHPFSIKSWIRMEDGSEHSDVDLTSTIQ